MNGIVGWNSYVPRARLDRAALASMFQVAGPRGVRSVAGPDEDALTMAVEAARPLVAPDHDVETCWFATSHAPMLDRGNAAVLSAAIGLTDEIGSYDTGGSIRSGIAALRAAASQSGPAIAALSDIRYGRPGSDDEASGADAAAAFAFGPDPLVEIVAQSSVSSPVMDRWRAEGDIGSSTWDDRWTAGHQVPLVERVITEALKQAGISETDLAAAVVSCPSSRAEAQVVSRLGVPAREGDPRPAIGYAGTADVGVRLASALDAAGPDQWILVATGADGADAMVLRTSSEFTAAGASPIADGNRIEPSTYLLWRGLIERAAVRRPPAEAPAAPAVARNEPWKLAFTASTCTACGTRHLPPQRVCLRCQAVDQMESISLRDTQAVVRTFTIDRLAASINPPVVVGVLDFDGGGRYRCQLTDVVASDVAVGDRVEMVYRLVFESANGVRNYFWKARPVSEEDS